MASPASQASVVCFGAFELDAIAGELRKGGIPLKLHPQPFRVLLLLTQRAGEVVTREQIQECLWGNNTFVDFDRGINFCISQIRTALADDAEEPRYVETIPRRGYRFLATVKLVQPSSFPVPRRPATAISDNPGFQDVAVVESAAGRGLASESKPSVGIHAVPSIVPSDFQRKWSRWTITVALVALLAAAAMIAASRSRLRNSSKLTERDTVVLADFTNGTGEPIFDDTLKQGLAVQLAQSPFLSILSDEKVAQTLKFMGRAPDERLTASVAREVCERTGSRAYFSGSIAKLNSQYVIGLNAVNCQTGDSLARTQFTADRKEDVLKALNASAQMLRKNVGESVATLQKLDVPIEQATTPSLDALQAYGLGKTMMLKDDPVAAVPLFQRAIRLDPQFAMAYASLGAAYAKLHESRNAAENETKAYEMRDRTSEPEKFYIEAHYHSFVTGSLEDARETYETWALTYPRDAVPEGNLGPIYGELGEPEKRLEVNLRAMQLDPEDSSGYSGAVAAYLALDRFDEAQAVGQRALAKGLDSYALRLNLYEVAFCQKDTAGMAMQVQWAKGKPGIEDLFLGDEAATAAHFGRLKEARELFRRAAESALRSEDRQRAGANDALLSLREANIGSDVLAKHGIAAALAEAPEDLNVRSWAAETLARAGDSAGAAEIMAKLVKEFPRDTGINNVVRPTVAATISLNEGNASKAVDALREVFPYELSEEDGLYSAYLRGLAFLQLHDGPAAVGEFQRILSHPGVVSNELIGALARLQLGRSYLLLGDRAKAEVAYQNFLTLWKDADPDIPILKLAKAEYSKLK